MVVRKDKQRAIALQSDIVGLELGNHAICGIPAVRLRRTAAGALELVAAELLDFPTALPTNAQTAQEANTIWRLPRHLRANHVALTFTSPHTFIRQVGESSSSAQLPVDHDGLRQVTYGSKKQDINFVAGMPEYYVPWALRRFPEGRRPTICSLQISQTALLHSFLRTSFFQQSQGNCIAILVHNHYCHLAAFKDGELILLHHHPEGTEHLLTALSEQLHVKHAVVAELLNDNIIDPTHTITPILQPLFRQAEISADYLMQRLHTPVKHFCAYGHICGTQFWQQIFTAITRQKLSLPPPWENIIGAVRAPTLKNAPHTFLNALGAAQATMGAP